MFRGKRIAVLGLGRSGLFVAQAASSLGAEVAVYDRSTREQILKPDILDEALAAGVKVELGWGGEFSLESGNATEADILVANPAVDSRSPILQRALTNGVEVISEVEFAYRIAKAPIIAITGTNGKTTTTVMAYLALQACGEDPILCGNIFGSGYPEMTLTEAAMIARPDQVLVAEISSFQLEWVRDFRPVAAAITNIAPDHQDRYDKYEDYAEAKERIFAAMGEGTYRVRQISTPLPPSSFSDTDFSAPKAWGRENEEGDPKSNPSSSGTLLAVGPGGAAEITEDSLRLIDASIPLSELPFQEPHNRVNAAMAGLLVYGYFQWKLHNTDSVSQHRNTATHQYPGPQTILQALTHFHGVSHRMERLGDKNGVAIINNSMCTNPDAVSASVNSVPGRKHVLIGGVNKGLDFAPLRRLFSDLGNQAYLFGRDREQIGRMLEGSHRQFETMGEAFATAAQEAKSGETIMLSPGCASSDQFKDFRDRGDVFKKIAKEWLNR